MSKYKEDDEYLKYIEEKERKLSKLDYIIFKIERIEKILFKMRKVIAPESVALTREQISFEGED